MKLGKSMIFLNSVNQEMRQDKSKSVDIALITSPRIGKHWFKWYIENNTDLNLETIAYTKKAGSQEDQWFTAKFNQLESLDNTMAIIRDPKDSLASIITMESLQNIEFRLEQYIYYYEFILDNVRNIFRFEDVISKPAKIAEYFCKMSNKTFNPVQTEYAQFQQWYLQTQDRKKLITSKDSNLYEESRCIIDNMDLSDQYRLYGKALDKCLNV